MNLTEGQSELSHRVLESICCLRLDRERSSLKRFVLSIARCDRRISSCRLGTARRSQIDRFCGPEWFVHDAERINCQNPCRLTTELFPFASARMCRSSALRRATQELRTASNIGHDGQRVITTSNVVNGSQCRWARRDH